MLLSKRWQGLLTICLALTLALVVAFPAQAQRDTGIMSVRALDPDGVPLPGVMVVAKGPVGTQTQFTGIDGTARFPGLYPGSGYTATFTLDGFKTVIREGLSIQAQRTTAFDLEMELASVEETITVTGESPVVDVRSTNIAGLYSDSLIDMTPTASGLWAGVLDHVPGTLVSTDVGGGDSGQQTSPRAWGSETRNNTYNVNGGDITDPAAVGASSSYFAVGAFEEVSVSLAAQDIEIKSPGVNINMVVKSGSNDWHGGVKYFYEGEGLVSNNVDQELMDAGVTEGTPNELLSDLDIQGGGPIVADRAWFFLDYWNFEIRKVVLGLEERDTTKLRDWTLNVNTQISPNNKISGRWIATQKFRNNRGATQAEPYRGRIQDSHTSIPQLQWQSVLNQNLFLDVRYSIVRSTFPLTRRDGDSLNPQAGYVDRPARFDFTTSDYTPRPANPPSEFLDHRDTDSLNGTMSWYRTGENASHDIKFGGNYQNIDVFAPENNPNGYRPYVRTSRIGSPRWDPDNNPNYSCAGCGVPVEVRLYNITDAFVLNSEPWEPDNGEWRKGYAAGLFVQDTVTIANKVTLVGGLRWDYATNWNPAQNRLDSVWCGETAGLNSPEQFCGGSFERTPNSVRWSDITPRIGVVYDVLGDGRWALKFNCSRYAEALGVSFASNTNVNGGGREDWDWFDPNGDGIFQFGEQLACGEADPSDCFRNDSFPGLGTTVDPTMVAPITNEFTFGVDHELFDNILVSVTGIVRGRNDDTGSVDIGRPFGPMFATDACRQNCNPTLPYGQEPWVPVQTVDPGNDGVIGTADDGPPITIYALQTSNPDLRGTNVSLSTNVGRYGFNDITDFLGASFVVSKRWSNNWQMLASYDYGIRSEFEGSGTNPNTLFNNRRQDSFASRPHIFKVTTNYLIAEPVGVNLGLFVRAQSGEPMFFSYSYDDSIIEPPNSPYCCQGNTTITVDARGQANTSLGRPVREDFLTIVDIRAEKQVTMGRYGMLHVYLDVFNLFNANTVTELEERLGRNYLRVDDVLSPRVIRLGGAWDF